MKTRFIFICLILVSSFCFEAMAQTYRKPLPNITSTLDPQSYTDAYSFSVINQIYDRLFDLDELNAIKPKLASSWEVDLAGKIYNICLKENVLFHDGKPLSTKDVLFTLERLLRKRAGSFNEFLIIRGASDFQNNKTDHISGITLTSSTCLSIELESPFPPFINMLAAPDIEILPLNLRGKTELDFFQYPIGTGPFKVLRFLPGMYVELISNSNYFLGQARTQSLIYEKTDRDKAIANFNKRYYHDLEWFYPQPTELSIDYSVTKVPIFQTNLFALNHRTFPFNDLYFRKAFSYAVNKKALIDACFPGNKRAKGYIPPGMAGHSSELFDYEYNPESARQMLKKSKSPKSEIVILRPDNYPCKDIFKKLVEEDLRAVGINAKVQHILYSDILNKYYYARAFEAINMSFTADIPEALFMLNDFRSISPLNYSGFASNEVDSLLKTASSCNDRYERYRIYEQIQKLLIEKAVTLNLYYHVTPIVMQSNIKGFVPSPVGTFYTSMWPVYIEEDEK